MRTRHIPILWRWLFIFLTLGQLLVNQSTLLARPALAASQATTLAEIKGFIDGALAAQMRTYHLSGAAVAIVVEGHLVVLKGYGLADLAQMRPVDPVRTVFPLASLAKLFTATAVMQLVEQGKLDLNADINTYLGDFPIVNRYPQPITLAHLLSHTPGFETRTIGDFTCAGQQPPTLEEFLAAHRVQQVRPPGEAPAYSNEGIDLAGVIVQRVSGLPYATYMHERIFAPLVMQWSTLAPTVPPNWANTLAKSYTYAANAFQLVTPGCFNHGPSGGLYGSASDMARFMLAQLQDGELNGRRILQSTTAQQMHSRLYTFDPRVSGNAYGFWESTRNEQRMLYHFGGLPEVYSVMALLPARQVGFFAVYNSADGVQAAPELLQIFLDYYYPVGQAPLPAPPDDFTWDGYIGAYASLRRPLTTLDELGTVLLDTVQVRATANGDLMTIAPGMGQLEWRAIAPRLFRNVGGQGLLVFRVNQAGQATYLLFDSDPSVAYAKLAWYETPAFMGGCAALLVVFQLWTMGLWTFYALRHVRRRSQQNTPSLIARLFALGMQLCLLSYASAVLWLGANNDFCCGVSPFFGLMVTIAYLGILLLIGVWLFTFLAWKDHYWRISDRLHYTLVALAGLVLLWVLYHWHMLQISG